MDASSACPLRVASVVWQPRPGSFALTVVCKATYALLPGTAPLAPTQEEPHPFDAFWGDDPRASLRQAGDLAPFKRRADVLVVGHAYAPGGQPVTALAARLVCGEIDKEIAVHGDRVFMSDGRLGEPVGFTKMPLRWERAAGGPDTQNPVGLRIDAPPDRLGRVPLPNLLRPGARIEGRGDVVEPVGFGPLSPGWPGRLAHLYRHAAGWDPRRWMERPLPDGIDAGYFNAAPPDQQTGDIPPNARLVLTSLHPEHARLVTSLQPVVPRAVCRAGGAPPHEVRLRCDTLCIDTDRAIVSLVWRGVVQLDHPAQAGQVVVSTDAPLPVAAAAPAKRGATVPMEIASLQAPVPLPFTPGSGPSPAAQPSPPAASDLARVNASLGSTANLDPAIIRAALPFAMRPPAPVSAPVVAEPPAPPQRAEAPAAVPLGVALLDGGFAPNPPLNAPPAASIWARGGPPVSPIAPIAPIAPLPAPPSAPPLPPVVRSDPVFVAARASAIDPLHLVWFATEVVPVVRKDPRWSSILDGLDDRALDTDLDDPDLAADVADLDERREVFEILARGAAVGEEGVNAALAGGVRADGRFVQPIALVAGELAFPFDPLEALKAMISAAAPYAGADPEAKAVLELAKEFLGSPGQLSAPAVAEGLTTRIRETFEKRGLVSAGSLDAHAVRALVRGRHHQRRSVLGGVHVRAWWNPGAGPPIPAYLDRRGAAKLPAAERLRARMLVFVHPTLEQNETHPAALRVVALAVVNAPLARR